MIAIMNSLSQHIGSARANWMQYHLPWLAVLAFLFGLSRDETSARDSSDSG